MPNSLKNSNYHNYKITYSSKLFELDEFQETHVRTLLNFLDVLFLFLFMLVVEVDVSLFDNIGEKL